MKWYKDLIVGIVVVVVSVLIGCQIKLMESVSTNQENIALIQASMAEMNDDVEELDDDMQTAQEDISNSKAYHSTLEASAFNVKDAAELWETIHEIQMDMVRLRSEIE